MTNIMVVDNDAIENKYYTNHLQNENSYIVINTECDDENIDYLLLNIDVDDYKRDKYINENVPNLDYINGFLYIRDWYTIDEIIVFLDKNKKYFIDDLKSDLIILHKDILKEIEKLEGAYKLYSDEYYKKLFIDLEELRNDGYYKKLYNKMYGFYGVEK